MKNLDTLTTCIPIVSAIIEREHQGQIEILVQKRWQPEADPKYSGTLEIPGGWIEKYENVYDALRREVYEETGLRVTRIKPDIKTKIHSVDEDGAFAFIPFCCQQQVKNGLPWIGFVFICEVEDAEPRPQKGETKDVTWITKTELEKMVNYYPEKIFTLQLGVLDFYINFDSG